MNRQRPNPSQRLITLLLVLIALLPAGCATVEHDVTFYQDEEWKGSTRIGVAPQVLAIGGRRNVHLQNGKGKD